MRIEIDTQNQFYINLKSKRLLYCSTNMILYEMCLVTRLVVKRMAQLKP